MSSTAWVRWVIGCGVALLLFVALIGDGPKRRETPPSETIAAPEPAAAPAPVNTADYSAGYARGPGSAASKTASQPASNP